MSKTDNLNSTTPELESTRGIIHNNLGLQEEIHSILQSKEQRSPYTYDGTVYKTEEEFTNYLGTIDDYYQLIVMWRNSPSGSKPEQLIENRILESIEARSIVFSEDNLVDIVSSLHSGDNIISDSITKAIYEYLKEAA